GFGKYYNDTSQAGWCDCGGSPCGSAEAYTNWYYKDSSGVTHNFNGTSYLYTGPPFWGCNPFMTGFTASSTDGEGYTLTTMGGGGSISITAYLRPKYHILSLLADTPGNRSANCFTNSTFYGTTNSVSNSFSNVTGVTYSQSSKFFGVIGQNSSFSISFLTGH